MLESRTVLYLLCSFVGAGGGGGGEWGGLVFCALRVVDGMRLGGAAGHVDCM